MRIAIMQPTYLPWLGYFAMMDQVEKFVFFDSVQFAARSWQQRNRIKTGNGELMLAIPVSKKGKRDQLIREVEIQTASEFPTNHIKAITMAYSRAPHFQAYAPQIIEVLEKKHVLLADLTIELIQTIHDLLGLRCSFMRSSELDVDGSKADLLADICSKLNANVYLSAPGSREYIELSDAFQTRNIEVIYNEYHHPQYHQLFGEFLPYMGAIDLLFNEGPNSLAVLRSGIKQCVR
jgi:hypothetical protein